MQRYFGGRGNKAAKQVLSRAMKLLRSGGPCSFGDV
jgi:hypothetical protein